MKRSITILLLALLMASGINAFAQELSSDYYKSAREVLGKDLVTPQEVSAAFGFVYSDKQLRHFSETLPSAETLKQLKKQGFAVVAGPPVPVSILVLHAFHPKFFLSSFDEERKGWYLDTNFAARDHAESEWLIIKKEPLSDSTNKYYSEQMALISDNESIPNAGEMAWFMATFYEVRKEKLLEHMYVRTSSTLSNGNNVIIGFFTGNGFALHSYWDLYASSSIGITAKVR